MPVKTDCSEPLDLLRLPFERFPFDPFPLPDILFGNTGGMWRSVSDVDEHDFKSCIGSLHICSLPALLPPTKII